MPEATLDRIMKIELKVFFFFKFSELDGFFSKKKKKGKKWFYYLTN